ncbi:hypothetical protein GCM10009789_28500 [Kribbella sancticallisti]|uniref:Uncharacterized protein n=1 Tax=Kribbella sancticallisti TaxID=460087 RepID=A0ABP4P650_9ACTN
MAGAITQNPVGIGEQTVAAAMKVIRGESVPKVIDTGLFWYDKTNIDDPKIAAVLYQRPGTAPQQGASPGRSWAPGRRLAPTPRAVVDEVDA